MRQLYAYGATLIGEDTKRGLIKFRENNVQI